MKSRHIKSETISTGSMADIAFLLLIFFLVSTTILQEKGLMLKLPPDTKNDQVSHQKDRNVFNIRINSSNQYLIENEVTSDLSGLEDRLKSFILNPDQKNNLAETPKKAIISIKTDRGTHYYRFIEILDLVKESYYQIYADRVGMNSDEFRALKPNDPEQLDLYRKGKEGIPMNISVAEPDH